MIARLLHLLICDIPLIVIFYTIINDLNTNDKYRYIDIRIQEMIVGFLFGCSLIILMIKTLSTYSLSIEIKNIVKCYLIQMFMAIPMLVVFKVVNTKTKTE